MGNGEGPSSILLTACSQSDHSNFKNLKNLFFYVNVILALSLELMV